MDEWIDALDAAGEKTGEVVLKSVAHRDGLWHGCFHCWVFGRDEAGEPYLLLQRRSLEKETWPGELDVTVGGHLGAGESPLDGRREIEEEIGLRVEPRRLVPLGARKIEREIPAPKGSTSNSGMDREFHHVFLLFDSTPPENLVLQREEVHSVLSLTIPDAERLAEGEEFPATEFRQGVAGRPTRVSLAEVVGEEGDYLGSVISSACATFFR